MQSKGGDACHFHTKKCWRLHSNFAPRPGKDDTNQAHASGPSYALRRLRRSGASVFTGFEM